MCLFPKKWFSWEVRPIYTVLCSLSFAYDYIFSSYWTQLCIWLWHLEKNVFKNKFKDILLSCGLIKYFSAVGCALEMGYQQKKFPLVSCTHRFVQHLKLESLSCGSSTGLRLKITMVSLQALLPTLCGLKLFYFCCIWAARQVRFAAFTQELLIWRRKTGANRFPHKM